MGPFIRGFGILRYLYYFQVIVSDLGHVGRVLQVNSPPLWSFITSMSTTVTRINRNPVTINRTTCHAPVLSTWLYSRLSNCQIAKACKEYERCLHCQRFCNRNHVGAFTVFETYIVYLLLIRSIESKQWLIFISHFIIFLVIKIP